MQPRSRLQSRANKRGKRLVVDAEPQQADRTCKSHMAEIDLLNLIASPTANEMGSLGMIRDGAGHIWP